MILTYRIFTTILYPFLFIFLYYRKFLKKEDPKRFKEKILISHFRTLERKKSKLIWFHAASVGEFKSIIPIINQLNKKKNLKILVTTTTFSSGNLAKIELRKFKNVEHRYFPFDVNFLINKFLNKWKPDRIFLVDSEIWPNLILNAKKFKIPIALLNARLRLKSFNKWMIFSSVAKKIFGIFDLCICSNLETKKFLKKLEAKNIYFKGNIKLINYIDYKKISNINEGILLKKRFWLASSTHKEEDIFCINTHLKLKKKYKDIITIVAPRHTERAREIKILCEKFNLNVQILDKNEIILKNKEFIIINQFGVLPKYFKYAKSVFIGKSMIKRLENDGGQNPIDAAKLRCKIYHGPYVYNFEEIYKILQKYNISKKIKNYNELCINLISDLKQPHKKINQMPNSINNLALKTLNDTIRLINNFIFKNV